MHAANYVFGSDGVVNQTGGWNTGLAFLVSRKSTHSVLPALLIDSIVTVWTVECSMDCKAFCDLYFRVLTDF